MTQIYGYHNIGTNSNFEIYRNLVISVANFWVFDPKFWHKSFSENIYRGQNSSDCGFL